MPARILHRKLPPMLRLLRPLTTLLGLVLLMANAALALALASAENRASGSAAVAEHHLVSKNPQLSEEAVRENLTLRYDLASDSPVVTNSVGGRVYTSVGEINQFNFRGIVNTELYNGGVSILSGVDGFANGSWIAASDLFEADVATFGGTPGVSVYNLATMSAPEITSVMNGPGAVIGAFCNSGVCLAPYW